MRGVSLTAEKFRRIGDFGRIKNSSPNKARVWELRNLTKIGGAGGWLDRFIETVDGKPATQEQADQMMVELNKSFADLMSACDDYLKE